MSVDKSQLDSLRIERPQEEARKRRPMIAVLAVIVVIAIALIVIPLVARSAKVVTIAPARAIASQGRTAVLNASGYVTARRQSTVSSKVTGKIVSVNIEEGMHVQAGQELARLDESVAGKGLAL